MLHFLSLDDVSDRVYTPRLCFHVQQRLNGVNLLQIHVPVMQSCILEITCCHANMLT